MQGVRTTSRLLAAVLVTLAGLVPAVLPAPAHASTTCKKAGAVRVVKRVTWTCTSQQGRLTWRRSGAAGAASTGRAPSSAPVYVQVYNALNERRRAAAATTYAEHFEWVIAPTISASRQEVLKRDILDAFAVWAAMGVETRGIRIMILDELSADMFARYKYAGDPRTAVTISADSHYGFLDGMGSRNPVFFMGIGSNIRSWSLETLYHEVAHLGQAAILMRGLADEPAAAPASLLPCWIWEAEASIAQKVFAGPAADTGSTETWRASSVVTGWRHIIASDGLTTDAALVDYLERRQHWDDSCFVDRYRYGPAAVLYEKLYHDFDAAKILEFRHTMATRPWVAEFARIFGMTPRAWYASSVVPYIRQQVAG